MMGHRPFGWARDLADGGSARSMATSADDGVVSPEGMAAKKHKKHKKEEMRCSEYRTLRLRFFVLFAFFRGHLSSNAY